MTGGLERGASGKCSLSMRKVLVPFPKWKSKANSEFRIPTTNGVGLLYFFHFKIIILCCMAILVERTTEISRTIVLYQHHHYFIA